MIYNVNDDPIVDHDQFNDNVKFVRFAFCALSSPIYLWVIPQYCPKIGVFKINFFLFAKMIFSPQKIFSITETIYERDKKR